MTHSAANPRLTDASEQIHRQLFETSRDGLFMIDRDGRIVDANPSFCRMVGHDRDDLCALTVDELTPELQCKPRADFQAQANSGEIIE